MTALAFGAPAVLWALLLLPVLWWLLRATPPRPQDISFAPTRLLLSLAKREETPSRTPWWLMLLRLVLAALVILALAQPILRPDSSAAIGDGPILIAVDDTFAANDGWAARVDAAERIIDQAERADRPVILVPTSDANAPLIAGDAAEAREALGSLEPQPWPARRGELAERIAVLSLGGAVWLADGLATDGDAPFAEALGTASAAAPRILAPEPGALLGVSTVANTPEGMAVTVVADADPGRLPRTVIAVDGKGFVLAQGTVAFEPGETEATTTLDVPIELRNDAVRVALSGVRSAAAVRLLDERFRRRTVGLISGGSADLEQPLLSPLHYLRAALEVSSDLREPTAQSLTAGVEELIEAGTSVIVLADVGTLLPSAQDALARWINAGGVLIRFAGPRTADGTDDLVPVPMRDGARTLGGTLSWNDPQPLTDFNDDGPFAEISVPNDVVVSRQVLAEPSIALTERTWAALADGTPFITGRSIGGGWVVFVHVTADTSWSSFPLSAGYVEILRALVSLSTYTGDTGGQGASLPPFRVLDGAGRLIAPGALVRPLERGDIVLGPTSPPGLYGSDGAYRAVNVLQPGDHLPALKPASFAGVEVDRYSSEGPTELRGALLTMAALLLLADALAILILMGAFRRSAVAAIALALLVPAGIGPFTAPAHAQTVDDPALRFAMEAALTTRLAYVSTGDQAVDRVSHAGLRGLSYALAERTAIEPGEPMGVNIETDELAFFPLLYWPVSASSERPSDEAMSRIDAYMKNGGTILFDTRDQAALGVTGTSPATDALRRILDGVDIPALEPVPPDHVLTKTFYLLQGFPGRWSGAPLWVEALTGEAVQNRPARAGDGVSPVLMTANDMAGAWAINEDGSYLFPTANNDPYLREMAIRAGINIAIYTMTGNYKADQVHIPALLERLGQ